MARYWLGVVTREHVLRAVEGGFCQFRHGKVAPVRRLSRGDGVLYYSPHEVRAFTALGRVVDDEVYEVDGFMRRRVDYAAGKDVPIAGLLDDLSFTRGVKSWGMVMRRSFFEVAEADFELVARHR